MISLAQHLPRTLLLRSEKLASLLVFFIARHAVNISQRTPSLFYGVQILFSRGIPAKVGALYCLEGSEFHAVPH